MFISYSITPSTLCVNRVHFYIDTPPIFKFNTHYLSSSIYFLDIILVPSSNLNFILWNSNFIHKTQKGTQFLIFYLSSFLSLEPLKERRTYQISPIQYVRLLTRLLIQFSKVNFSYLSYACFPASRSALISSTFLGVSL